MLFRKCRYGLASPDEAFYLVTPFRLLHGDRMLLEEWHLTQFSSFTMIPEVGAYLLLAGNTDGMLLTFRVLYTGMWGAACLFLYFRMRAFHPAGAMCASLFLLCYAPFGIMAFSYNSLGILYLMNAAVFLLCARRHRRIQHALAGLFFAGAVLCCPYLMLIYGGYSLALGIRLMRGKAPLLSADRREARQCWQDFTLGAGILAAVFLAVLLSRASLSELGTSLQHALQDEEHAPFSLLQKGSGYVTALWQANRFFPLLMILTAVLAVLTRIRRHPAFFWAVCAASLLSLRQFLVEEPYLNYLMLPLTFPGIYVLAVTRSRRIRQLGWFWLVPGILYTFCLHCTSNTGFYAISSAGAISSSAGLVLMGMYCRELQEENHRMAREGRILTALSCAAALICFGFQMRYEIPLRYQTVFQEPGLMEYEEQRMLEAGPQKGIVATAEDAENYERMYRDAAQIQDKRVLFLTAETWPYLMNRNGVAAFSGWLGSINNGWDRTVSGETMTRLKRYYDLRPEKRPDVIFTDGENSALPAAYFDFPLSEPERLENGYVLIRRAEPGS